MKRRDFIRKVTSILAGLGISHISEGKGDSVEHTDSPSSPTRSKPTVSTAPVPDVVRIHCPQARLTQDTFDKTIIKEKIDSALRLLTNTDQTIKAWRSLFSTKDIVGLKLNCLAGKGLSSTPELVYGIADSLLQAGVPEQNIIIWERFDRELIRAGFKINRSSSGIRCFGTERNYDPEITSLGSVGSCLSQIFLSCSAIINIGVIKDHNLSGASIGMKNLFGIIHNPNKYHFNNCNPYVADLSASQPVRKRLRLIIGDALWAQYENGPARDDRYRWAADSILAGLDPVALDAIGISMLETKRKEAGIKSLAEEGRAPLWLETAGKLGLGKSDLTTISIVTL